ncbi:unnamed protein product, partial [marine sediment metagenome]
MPGFTGNFGQLKSGLSTVEWAWFDDAGDIIGAWTDTVPELYVGTGIYYISEVPPVEAYFLAMRTGEAENEIFLIMGLWEDALVFDFGPLLTGKTVGYRFFTANNTPIAAEITADVSEFMGMGLYIATNVTIPDLAVF